MEKVAKRKFWTDFFIAAAICFVDVIVIRLLVLFSGTFPLWVSALLIAAVFITEAIIFTKKTGRTLMFPVESLVFQLLNLLTYIVYVWCLFDGLAASETDSGLMMVLEAIAGVALIWLFIVLLIVTAMWCVLVFVVTLVPSLITKAVMNKKEKSSDVPEIETTREVL